MPFVALRDAGCRELRVGQTVQYMRIPSIVDPNSFQATRLSVVLQDTGVFLATLVPGVRKGHPNRVHVRSL